MTTIRVDIDKLAGAYRRHERHVPIAVAATLNRAAWKAKAEIEHGAAQSLRFKARPSAAMQIIAPRKAAPEIATKENLEAVVFTKKQWLFHQVQSGTTTPVSGITYKGRQYLLIPSKAFASMGSKAKTRLKEGGSSVFVIDGRSGPVLAVRRGPDGARSRKARQKDPGITRRSNITILGHLVPSAKYADKVEWEAPSEAAAKHIPAMFAQAMDRAIATGSGKMEWRYYKG